MVLIRCPQLSVTISDSEHCNPNTFFRTRGGFYVWDDFHSRAVSETKSVKTVDISKGNVDDLGADLTDKEVENGLSKNHLWDEGALCAVVAEMISKQLGGEEGNLLNNGYSNLFYMRFCVVYVHWRRARRQWFVGTLERVGFRWHVGARVLSPVN